MSNLLLSKAFQAEGLTSSQKFVLISLSDQASDTGVCWPSINHIAQRTALSRATVKRALGELAELQILQVHRRKTTEKLNKTSIYKININALKVNECTKELQKLDAEILDIPEVGGWVHHEPRVGSPRTGGRVTMNLGGVHHEPQTQREPKDNPNINNTASPRFDAKKISLPECISSATWEHWIDYRRLRKLTCVKPTMEGQIKKLEALHNKGYNTNDIIQNSIDGGWQGVFEPKNKVKQNQVADLKEIERMIFGDSHE